MGVQPRGIRVPCGYNGMELAVDIWGELAQRKAKPTIIFLHGGGQTRHSWDSSAQAFMEKGFLCITFDAKAHGGSYWDPREPNIGYDFLEFGKDLEALVAALGLNSSRAFLVGASMGGLSMLNAPQLLNHCAGAILVDVVLQLEGAGVSRITDFMLANIDEGFASILDAAESVRKYQPQRNREITPQAVEGLKKNLRQGQDGRWRWHWDPQFMRRSQNFGTAYSPAELYKLINAGDPSVSDHPRMIERRRMEENARKLTIPVLVIRGRMSDVVSPAGVEHLRSLIPHLEYVDVKDASHMVAGDSNGTFLQAIETFIGGRDLAARSCM